MILDYIDRSPQYNNLFPLFQEAMEFAMSVKDKPTGRYEQGEYFALVQEMDTVPPQEKKFELHRNFLDVHIVLSGEEVLEYEDIRYLPPASDYDQVKDIQRLNGEGQAVLIKEGMFCLVFAHDGHKPACCRGESKKLRKIVLKIPQP